MSDSCETTHPINRTSVLELLSRHIGKASGIKGADMVRRLTRVEPTEGTQRALRKTIEALRNDGYPVCGFPGEGYYMAASDGELVETCLFLYARAMTSLNQVAKMRGVSELDLKGQLRLTT